ncbi:MAG: hypothetical protein Q9220_000786 [cf. Caloplaca sp. 1 TL-2023]
MSRFSPPPYPSKDNRRAPPRDSAIPFRRSRYIYLALAVVLLYLALTKLTPLFSRPSRTPQHAPSLRYKNVNWSRYAYFQYATSTAYLCNAVMIFEALDRLGSKADRLLVYPEQWDTRIESQSDRDSQLLVKARDWYNVKLVPMDIPVMHDEDQQGGKSEEAFLKFGAWGPERYERVIYLASDTTVIKHLDDLFFLPSTPVAMTREYWNLPEKKTLSPRFMVIQPSQAEFERLSTATREDMRPEGEYDTEILNRFYGDSAMVLPHQAYGLLSSEFRTEDHREYLGNTYDPWDPEKALQDASVVHFVDEPFPKPWVMWPHVLFAEKHPQCKAEDCRDKETWLSLYDDFRKRRKDICALLSATAPEWPPRNKTRKHSAAG